MEGSDNNTPQITSEQDPYIGQIIAGKYKIVRQIEKGGMGAIFEGQHLILERPIAIKLLHGHIADDVLAPIRFLREAKATAKIEHPNAITIFDFGVLQGNVGFIVMEYIRGRTLRQWLVDHAPISLEQTVEWLDQICEAVAAAHNQEIIHRDLKPENIMFKELSNDKYIAKVVDFGLAKMLYSDGARITNTGDVIGTPYYMAPECCDGQHVDHRADIYALGIIAYEMLTGRPPFTGSVHDIFLGHMFKDAELLHSVNPAVPAIFDRVIRRAMAKNPAHRYASTLEFADRLKHALTKSSQPTLSPNRSGATSLETDTALKASPVSSGRPAQHKSWFISVGVILLGLFIGILWVTSRIQNATLKQASRPLAQQISSPSASPAKQQPTQTKSETAQEAPPTIYKIVEEAPPPPLAEIEGLPSKPLKKLPNSAGDQDNANHRDTEIN